MTGPERPVGGGPAASEPSRTRPVTAVVPLRNGTSGKSRLAAALDPEARRRLVVTLARHVLGELAASPHVAGLCVVTADVPFVHEVLDGVPDLRGSSSAARQSGLPRSGRTAAVIPEPPGRPGLNAALDHAREHVRTVDPPVDRLLVVHADLPALAGADVAAVLTEPADVVVATDRHGAGTNLLALPLEPPGGRRARTRDDVSGLPTRAGYRFRFGAGSRAAHLAEAAERGLSAAVVRRPGTAADLDTIEDWDELPAEVRARVRDAVGADLP